MKSGVEERSCCTSCLIVATPTFLDLQYQFSDVGSCLVLTGPLQLLALSLERLTSIVLPFNFIFPFLGVSVFHLQSRKTFKGVFRVLIWGYVSGSCVFWDMDSETF